MKTIKLVSQHQINDIVKLSFGRQDAKYTVIAVKFTNTGKVLYDLYINLTMVVETEIKDVDSYFVEKLKK